MYAIYSEIFNLAPHVLPGKGIKDPEPGSKETCDCYSEGEKWETEDKDGNRSGLRKSKGKENSEEEESEERKESFEAVQFKSNQTKEKGFLL